MSIVRKFGLVAAVVLALAASSGLAFADPSHSRNAVTIPLTCGGVPLTVISPSEPAANALVVGDTGTLILTQGTLTLTYIDPQSGGLVSEIQEVVYGPGHGNAQGMLLTSCISIVTVQDPNVGPITGTLVGLFFIAPPK
ncbi:MAG TPA: hypothetical protein VFU22_29150 [Roseiflexaceae bacterium]|nr:hypothetical protein [Roseiflexaceae bacterium]